MVIAYARVVTVLLVAAGLALVVQTCRVGRKQAELDAERTARIAAELLAKGRHEGEVKPLDQGDTPQGAKPIIDATGRVAPQTPAPNRTVSTLICPPALAGSTLAPGPGAPPEPRPPEGLPVWPAARDLGCTARHRVETVGDRVFDRLWCGAELAGPDGSILATLPLTLTQERLLEADPVVVQPRPKKYGWTIGVAGGYDPFSKDARVVVGAMWGRRVGK